MLFDFLATMLAGLVIFLISGVESIPCPSDTVAINVISTEDVNILTDALNCTGQGNFDVVWYSNMTLRKRIEVSNMKNVTITGFSFPTISGGQDERDAASASAAVRRGTGLFSVSVGSTLRLSHLVLVGGNAETGGAVDLHSSSFLIVYSCNFTYNNASVGGAIYSSDSSVDVDGRTTFDSNSALNGGAIHAEGSNISIGGHTSFLHNAAQGAFWTGTVSYSAAYADENPSSQVLGVSFGGALYADGSRVHIDGDCLFFHNSADHGGAIDVYRSELCIQGNTSFVNNWAYGNGGALNGYLCEIYMQGNTSYVNNSANDGGAMFADTAEVYMEGITSYVNNWADSDGGAVVAWSSEVYMEGSDSFVDNSAEFDGGDVYHEAEAEPSDIANIRFIGNTAGVFAGAMHISRPQKLDFRGVAFKENHATHGGAIYVISTNYALTKFNACVFEGNGASEGGAIYFATGVGVDMVAASVFHDNFAEFSGGAIFHTGSLQVVDTSFEANMAGVKGPAIMSIGQIKTLSNVSFSGNSFHCREKLYGYVIEQESGFCGSCFDEVCSRCSTGHLDDTEFKEVRTNGIPVCKTPPAGAVAKSSGTTVATLSLENGYYRSSNQSHVIRKCYNTNACVGGNDTATYCALGYSGPYCAVCDDGYTQGLAYSCHECSRGVKRSAVGRAIAVGFAALLLAGGMFAHLTCVVRDGGAEDTSAERRTCVQRCWACQGRLIKMLPLVAIKIVVTVWQIISQFGAVAGDVYPEVYKAFVSTLTPINLDLDVVLSYSCVITTDFYDHLLLATIVPAVAYMTFAGSYLVAKVRNRGFGSASRAIRHKHQAVALYFTLFVYSPVSYKIFQTFACDELDDGNSYLRADYSLSCLTPRHSWYKVYALVMVGVYPIGIAALLAILLARYRHDLVKPERVSLLRLKPFHGVWTAYKPSRYYYEVVESGRRICLTTIAAFVPSNSPTQISVVLMFAVAWVFISEAISPFEKKRDMNLYRWGNGIIVASMYVAFLMKVDVGYDTDNALLTFSGVLILANLFMVVTILLQMAFLMKELSRTRQVVRAVDAPVRRSMGNSGRNAEIVERRLSRDRP